MVELRLEDSEAELKRRQAAAPRGTGGYDPYDRDPLQRRRPGVPAPAAHQGADVRQLSEWIRLQREIEALKQNDKDGRPKRR